MLRLRNLENRAIRAVSLICLLFQVACGSTATVLSNNIDLECPKDSNKGSLAIAREDFGPRIILAAVSTSGELPVFIDPHTLEVFTDIDGVQVSRDKSTGEIFVVTVQDGGVRIHVDQEGRERCSPLS
jgi:hypothetical protein